MKFRVSLFRTLRCTLEIDVDADTPEAAASLAQGKEENEDWEDGWDEPSITEQGVEAVQLIT